MSRPPRRRRLVALRVGLAGVAVSCALACCNEIEPPPASSYQPAEISEPDVQGVRVVTFTADAALRVGLETRRVTARGPDVVVPYAALIYDKQGKPWVYTVTEPLTYLRVNVVVKEEAGEDEMVLSAGPPVGTEVVTVGATQVYGAELGMDGNH